MRRLMSFEDKSSISETNLNKASNRIHELEREAKNENELDKILNSSFDGSEHKSLSFYGLPTKEARSPVVFK